jgi:hypothetical protein
VLEVPSYEEALIQAFVRPDRRQRLLELLTNSNGRRKLRESLAHFRDLDPRFAQRVPASKQHAPDIEAILREKGAPDLCHVLSESEKLDGRELLLALALGGILGQGMGTFVSCIPGRLGYFEAEDAGERYILERAV